MARLRRFKQGIKCARHMVRWLVSGLELPSTNSFCNPEVVRLGERGDVRILIQA